MIYNSNCVAQNCFLGCCNQYGYCPGQTSKCKYFYSNDWKTGWETNVCKTVSNRPQGTININDILWNSSISCTNPPDAFVQWASLENIVILIGSVYYGISFILWIVTFVIWRKQLIAFRKMSSQPMGQNLNLQPVPVNIPNISMIGDQGFNQTGINSHQQLNRNMGNYSLNQQQNQQYRSQIEGSKQNRLFQNNQNNQNQLQSQAMNNYQPQRVQQTGIQNRVQQQRSQGNPQQPQQQIINLPTNQNMSNQLQTPQQIPLITKPTQRQKPSQNNPGLGLTRREIQRREKLEEKAQKFDKLAKLYKRAKRMWQEVYQGRERDREALGQAQPDQFEQFPFPPWMVLPPVPKNYKLVPDPDYKIPIVKTIQKQSEKIQTFYDYKAPQSKRESQQPSSRNDSLYHNFDYFLDEEDQIQEVKPEKKPAQNRGLIVEVKGEHAQNFKDVISDGEQ